MLALALRNGGERAVGDRKSTLLYCIARLLLHNATIVHGEFSDVTTHYTKAKQNKSD
jgi:hypothetical protein